MPETEYSQDNLAAVRAEIEHIKSMLRLELTANPRTREHIGELLSERMGAAKVYMTLDSGPKTQGEIGGSLNMSQANVSKICTHLLRYGLLIRFRHPEQKGQFLYAWSDLEHTLGVSKIAKKML